MAVQAYPYLVMTDGTTTVTFADGSGGATNYPPVREGWAPAITALRRSELGGVGPYADVTEELEIIITGAAAAAALANLATLSGLLDQAERWWRRGENVDPVVLKYAPQGSTTSSTAAPLQAVVLGRAEGDETNLGMPIHFNDVGMIYEIRTVRVRFLRRGLWTGASQTASSASAANPSVLTATLPGITISSPMLLDLAFATRAAGDLASGTYLLTANDANEIQIYEAEALTTGPFTSVADSANSARGGSVLRYTPTDTLFNGTAGQDISSVVTHFQRIAVFAAVRNNSATTQWRIRAGFLNVTADTLFTSQVTIDTSTTSPRIVPIGLISNWSGDLPRANVFYLEVAASAVSGSLDIDYIALLAMNDECNNAIGFGTVPFSLFGGGGVVTIELAPGPLTLQQPFVNVSKVGVAGQYPVTYDRVVQLNHKGTAVAACYLATGGSAATRWRYYDGAAVVNHSISVTRYDSSVTPI